MNEDYKQTSTVEYIKGRKDASLGCVYYNNKHTYDYFYGWKDGIAEFLNYQETMMLPSHNAE